MLDASEQSESEDLNNLLHILHTTPIMDHTGIAAIAKAINNNENLEQLRDIVTKVQTWIPKTAKKELLHFKQILPEITVTGNGILLKDERIILPDNLQNQAIQLAHLGNHSGRSGLERRLRSHFFFFDLNKKAKQLVEHCSDCQIFTNKKRQEPEKPHNVPEKCWSEVAVDLFGPIPSSNHIVVVQDLASQYPDAKILSFTKASKVIPALADIYDAYGNPQTQLSDNGPPFNSAAMKQFTENRVINQKNIPPLHPSSNPVKAFMKPMAKTMKIARQNKVPEREAQPCYLKIH